MELYRIILVDDEEEVRKSIIKKINWADAGFQVVGDAENGEDALEKIELLEPDLVLTDIRMPYMDGLTLAEKVRQKYPSIKMVIFSGFDDFEYAKRAIKLNVIEYILKPVNVEELTAILKKIKTTLDEEISQRRNVDRLRENYRRNLPVIREQFLNDLIRRRLPDDVIEGKLKDYGINLAGAKKWVVVVIEVENAAIGAESRLSLHKEQELIPVSVRQMVKELLGDYYRNEIFTSPIELEQILVAAIDGDNTQTSFIDVLGDICKEIRRVLEVPITMGIGHGCTALQELPAAYQSAKDALGYKAIVGIGGTIYINDMEPVAVGKLTWESRDEADLFAAVKFGPTEKIEAFVAAVMDRMERAKVHVSQSQAFMLSIINSMIQLMQQYDLSLVEIMGSENGYQEVFGKLMKREEFGEWMLLVACRINQAMNKERESSTKQVIQEAKEYILENYSDPELSVEKICRHLHMSPAYFSTIFKKETGQAYIAYLTDIRLNKAIELLNKTDDKTYVIASKVGYQEQNYFSYVFKKKFGVSPTKYRGAK